MIIAIIIQIMIMMDIFSEQEELNAIIMINQNLPLNVILIIILRIRYSRLDCFLNIKGYSLLSK